MDILERRETWLHTYFVTNCLRLSVAQGREIEAAMIPVLRQHHIVYGMRFAESRHDPGIRIVLECIPLRQVLDHIEEALRRIVAPIPAKPLPAQVRVAEPGLITSQTEPSTAAPVVADT
jgi:hypothetical protein